MMLYPDEVPCFVSSPSSEQEIQDCVNWLKIYLKKENITQLSLEDIKPDLQGALKNFLMKNFFKELWQEDFENGQVVGVSFKEWREQKLKNWNKSYAVRIGENFAILTNSLSTFQLYYFDEFDVLEDTWDHDLEMLSIDPLMIRNFFGAICILTNNKSLQIILDGDSGWGDAAD